MLGIAAVSQVALAEFPADAGAGPSAPTLLTPADGSSTDEVRPVFTWSAPAGATGYHLQVSTDPGFGTTVIDDDTLALPTYTPGADLALDTYYWRVRATDGTWGDYATAFTLIVRAPLDTVGAAGPAIRVGIHL